MARMIEFETFDEGQPVSLAAASIAMVRDDGIQSNGAQTYTGPSTWVIGAGSVQIRAQYEDVLSAIEDALATT
jgi:hypothetical protein